MECSARDGKNTEFIFAEAAKLLLNDYIRYKIGNPSIGRTKSIKKILYFELISKKAFF